jgi:4-amino-4-deoxy-L-arabinose transferase-like glycosyltransferase
VAAAFLFSAAGITSSLWLDETGTFWVVKDGLREVVSRSWQWSGQSALYYVSAWTGLRLAPYIGLECALRLPSLLGMAAAVVLIYCLGKHLMDARVGAVAALAFLCLPDVSFATIDARPYALALAVLLAAMLCFFKWLDTGRPLFAVLYAIGVALVVYAHYLFALGLVAQLVYGLRRRRSIAALWVASGTLCLPLAAQLAQFFHTKQSHSFAGTPDIDALFAAIVRPVVAGAAALAAIGRGKSEDPPREAPWAFLFTWLLFPPTILFVLSVFTDTKLFVARYFLSCAPAAALLAAYVIVRCSGIRLASGILLVSLAFRVMQAGPPHGGEDWRGAMQTVRSQAVAGDAVLVASGFVEAAPNATLPPGLSDVLYAPQLAYSLESFIRLPYTFDAAAVPEGLAGRRRVFLVTRRATLTSVCAAALYENLLGRTLDGYRSRTVGDFGAVSVLRFERTDSVQ